MHQWRNTQAAQALTEQSLLMMQQSSQSSLGQIVRPWLREGSPGAPPGEQPLHMPEPPQLPAVQAVQMERPVVPPELLPMWREAAYAMYCQLCASRGQLPLPRDIHLPTPASVHVSNLHPYASPQQVPPVPHLVFCYCGIQLQTVISLSPLLWTSTTTPFMYAFKRILTFVRKQQFMTASQTAKLHDFLRPEVECTKVSTVL